MAATAGLAPWTKGFKRLSDKDYNQGFIPGHGFLAYGRDDKWKNPPKKPKGRYLTVPTTGVKYYVTNKDIEALIRTANSLDESGNYKYVPDEIFMRFIAKHNDSMESGMAEYIEQSFNGKGKGNIYSTEGLGHILQLEYNDYTQVMRVHFKKGAVCAYFRVPMIVFGELYHLAQSKITTKHTFDGKERSALGVRFWDLVRIRGSFTGGKFRFVYEHDNDNEPSINGPGRPQKNIIYEEETFDVPEGKWTMNKLKRIDPEKWYKYYNALRQKKELPFKKWVKDNAPKEPNKDDYVPKEMGNLDILKATFDTSEYNSLNENEIEDIPDNRKFIMQDGIAIPIWHVGTPMTAEQEAEILLQPRWYFLSNGDPYKKLAETSRKDSVSGMLQATYNSNIAARKKGKESYFKDLTVYRNKMDALIKEAHKRPELITEANKLANTYKKNKILPFLNGLTNDTYPEEKMQALFGRTVRRSIPLTSTAEDDQGIIADYKKHMLPYSNYTPRQIKELFKKNGFEEMWDDPEQTYAALFNTPLINAYGTPLYNKYKKDLDNIASSSALSPSKKKVYFALKGDTEDEKYYMREYYLTRMNLWPLYDE